MNQKEKSDLSRKLILEAAITEFGKNGYEKASTSAMCRYRGISKGKLYHHFEGKQELYLEAAKSAGDEFIKKEKEAYLLFGNDLKQNFHIFRFKRQELFEEKPYVCKLVWEATKMPPQQLKDGANEIQIKLKNSMTALITEMYKAAGLDNFESLDICVTATKMIYNQLAHTALSRLVPEDRQQNAEVFEEINNYADKFIDIILHGIAK